jgi:hypothetical protein
MNSSFGIGIGEVALLIILPLVLLFAIATTAFWIWALVDCAKNEPANHDQKVLWLVVIAVFHWLGALIYVIARRPARIKQCRC